MKFIGLIGQFFGRFMPKFGAFSGLHSLDSSALLEKFEEFAVGLGLAAVACYGSEFLPYWASFIALGAGAWALLAIDKNFFPVAARTSIGVTAVFLAFSQPWAAFLLVTGLTGLVGYVCFERLYGKVKSIAATVGTFVGGFAVYFLTATLLLPAVHPITTMLYNAGPLIAVGLGVLTTLYTTWRVKGDDDDRLFYKLAPGVCAVLFAVFFPMKNSWVGLGAEWLFVATTFALAFFRPRALTIFGTAFGAIFAGVFVLMNTSSFMHQVAMAESVSVTEVKRLPAAPPTRIMPLVVGGDFCVQGNDATMTQTSRPHAVILDGVYYWQCATHYTGFQLNHLFSWFPGSTAGFVMVNAGTTASDTRVNANGFIFGEDSALVKAAFEARHPNGILTGYAYAPDKTGKNYLVLTYTTNKLFFGAMLPTPGVMSVSPWGFVDDYTVAQAAGVFPGTFLYPSELARQYADAWGSHTIGKLISRSFLEVSEPQQTAQNNMSNPYPYGIDTKAGPKYFVPYEPQGKNGTAMSDVAFFDGATGDANVEILHLANSDEAGENNALGHRSIQGPRELLEKSANVVQGHFQLTAIEPIISVTDAGSLYFITANMGPDKNKSNHDYQGDTLSYSTGEPQWVITSSADAIRHIQEHEKSMGISAPVAAPISAPAPAPAPAAPAPTPALSPAAPIAAPATPAAAAPNLVPDTAAPAATGPGSPR